MDEKKSFFASLEPKSALIVGLVAGVLLIGTVGFIIMLVMNLGQKAEAKNNGQAAAVQPAAQEQQPAAQVTKSDKPKVELFVMSYCPYGLQMEKAYLPAWKLLGNKADISLKFVSYAMHGKKELDENTRQYCLAKNFNSKLIPYLECFTGKDDYSGCLQSVGVSEGQLASCVSATDKEFKITAGFDDQSTWLSGQFPPYLVHESLNKQYGVGGSPTLVVNGAEVSASRSPEAVKQLICSSFNNPPAECNTTLSSAQASAGFGTAVGTEAAAANCGP